VDSLDKFAAKIPCVNPKVSIGIVLFEKDFLESSLPSLFAQNYPNIEFLFRDNSNGEVLKFLAEKFPDLVARAKVLRGKNIFHSGGMNELIRVASGEYFIAASGDMLYDENFVTKAVEILEKPENQKFGALSGKLLRWNFEKNEKTEIIDSCGIGVTKSHKFFEIGGGEKDSVKFEESHEIFGVSGALGIFRKKALRDVEENGEIFDAQIHYKNDVDLAYRLQWMGWKAFFSPEIKCFHARNLGEAKSRQQRSNFEKENSTFGQLVVIAKNFSPHFSWWVKFWTNLRIFEIRLFGIFFEKSARSAFRKFAKIRGELEQSPRKIQAEEIEKLMQ